MSNSTLRLLFVVGLLSALNGCSSFRSTIMNRHDDDTVTPQNCTRTSAGIPVRLKVPSHVVVTISEAYQIVGGDNPEIRLLAHDKGKRVLDVETKLEYTDKVFTVDFPRPFSGDLFLGDSGDGLKFDAEQYFSQINGKIDDDTIEDTNTIVSENLPKLFETLNKSKSAAGLKGAGFDEPDPIVSDKVNVQYRVVAYQRFDISDPSWESQMEEFVNNHINGCSDSCPLKNCSSCTSTTNE